MKSRALVVLLALSTLAIIAGAQSSASHPMPAGETQARGYWIDASTGLMWAAKDNGKDVSWHSAMKYCRKLRLAGYSDWRLATLAELEGIYDKNANAPGLAHLGGPAKGSNFTWHVKGSLFLTGNQWADDHIGHTSSGYHSYFDFNEGLPNDQPSGWPYPFVMMRALCVRGSDK